MTTKTLIIPAAGSGKRLGQQVPKPFLKLDGRSVLEHTLRRFLPLEGLQKIVVAASADFLDEVNRILKESMPGHIEGSAIAGGGERQYSVYKALKELPETELVIIHDAVRPFVRLSVITDCCREASVTGAAVPGVPLRDTIKRTDDGQFVKETADRELYRQVQTPQVFKKRVIVDAYEKAMEENYIGTDDASLAERVGVKVKIVEGDHSNFKITYPTDLKLARLLIEKQGS